MPGTHGASMRPSTFTNASKFTDVDVEFQNCRFGEGSYADGSVTSAFLAELVDVETGDSFPQFWSIGSVETWTASDDGMEMVPTKDGATFKKTCNFALLMASLVEVGFNEDKLENAASINGLRVHLVAKAIKTTDGSDRTTPVAGKLLPHGLPWEASKRKATNKPKTTTGKPQTGSTAGKPATETEGKPETAAAPNPAAVPEEIKGYITMAVSTAIDNAGGSLARNQVMKGVMAVIQAPANKELYPGTVRSKIMVAVTNDDVLNSLEGIAFDGAILKMA